MKKVLVTGGSGFIGRWCLPALQARGYEVHSTCRRRPEWAMDGVTWHEVDLLDERPTVALLAHLRPSHLLHLAWVTKHGDYWTSSENLRWVQASLGLFQAFVEQGGARAAFAGTCAEYDWNEGGICSEEKTPLRPATLYGVCKNALRQIVESYAAGQGVSVAWGRLFFLYGPHEALQRFVPSIIRSLLRNEPALMTHGRQQRDFLYVEDAADALATLLDSSVQGPINIASGKAVALREVAERIAVALGSPGLVQTGALPARADDPPLIVADAHLLRSTLQWQPRRSTQDRFTSTVNSWQHLRGGHP